MKILRPHPDSATDLTGSVTPRGHSLPLCFDFSYVKKKGLGVGTPPAFKPRSLAILPFPMASDKLALQAKLSKTQDPSWGRCSHMLLCPLLPGRPFLMLLHLVPPCCITPHKEDIPIQSIRLERKQDKHWMKTQDSLT